MVMSALPPKADMCGATGNVCFGPKADIVGETSYRSDLAREVFYSGFPY
jgi:hypothetical protein